MEQKTAKGRVKYSKTSCYLCSEWLDDNDVEAHLIHCRQQVKECPNRCGAIVVSALLQLHLNTCRASYGELEASKTIVIGTTIMSSEQQFDGDLTYKDIIDSLENTQQKMKLIIADCFFNVCNVQDRLDMLMTHSTAIDDPSLKVFQAVLAQTYQRELAKNDTLTRMRENWTRAGILTESLNSLDLKTSKEVEKKADVPNSDKKSSRQKADLPTTSKVGDAAVPTKEQLLQKPVKSDKKSSRQKAEKPTTSKVGDGDVSTKEQLLQEHVKSDKNSAPQKEEQPETSKMVDGDVSTKKQLLQKHVKSDKKSSRQKAEKPTTSKVGDGDVSTKEQLLQEHVKSDKNSAPQKEEQPETSKMVDTAVPTKEQLLQKPVKSDQKSSRQEADQPTTSKVGDGDVSTKEQLLQERVNELEKKVTRYRQETYYTKQRVDDLQDHILRNVHDNGLASTNGRVLWRIDSFAQRLENAKENSALIRGPMFSSAPFGYVLQIETALDGMGTWRGRNMVIGLSMQPGPYDTLLEWPYKLNGALILHDQSPERSARQNVFRPIMVVLERNPGPRQYFVNIPHNVLFSRNFIHNDAIIMEVVVYPGGGRSPSTN